MVKKLKYNHPAMIKNDIDINKIYTLDELKKVYGNDISKIKRLFKPMNFKWEESKRKNNKTKIKKSKNDFSNEE